MFIISYLYLCYKQDMLKKNVDNTISSTKILTKHWENTLSDYSDTVLHNTILVSNIAHYYL